MELPHLVQFHNAYKSKGVEVLSVNLDQGRNIESAKELLRQHNARFTVVNDARGTISRAYNIEGIPATFIIDEEGSVVGQEVGFSEASFKQKVVSVIDHLLKENAQTAPK